MKKIELTIGNPYVSKEIRENRIPTVFRRVMSRLSEEGKNPGKVVPIFVIIENDFKIFGAFTFNSGGSVSFFPDFYNLDYFDHLTLNGNFIEKKGHLTKVELNGKRKKPVQLQTSELKTGNYHLITFGMLTADLLMDSPAEIDYAVIEYENEEQGALYNQWINESVTAGHCILDFPNKDGFYCVQIQVISKSNPSVEYAVEASVIEKLLEKPISLKEEIFIVNKYDIPTTINSDFNICILTFKVPYKMEGNFSFFIVQDPSKPLPKQNPC